MKLERQHGGYIMNNLRVYKILTIVMYIYSSLGMILLCVITEFLPAAITPLCIIAWASLFGVAIVMGTIIKESHTQVIKVPGTEKTEDIRYNFTEYQGKTFWAVVRITNERYVIQPVHLLCISDIDTLHIFYFNDFDIVFVETQINISGHNLWTTKLAAQAELCRRNPKTTLEDLNNE
jgi:hypothetical protein